MIIHKKRLNLTPCYYEILTSAALKRAYVSLYHIIASACKTTNMAAFLTQYWKHGVILSLFCVLLFIMTTVGRNQSSFTSAKVQGSELLPLKHPL